MVIKFFDRDAVLCALCFSISRVQEITKQYGTSEDLCQRFGPTLGKIRRQPFLLLGAFWRNFVASIARVKDRLTEPLSF